MTERSFATFADASAFAKQMSKEHKASVRLVRRANEFIVEGTFPADLPNQVEPESKQQHLEAKTRQPTRPDSGLVKSPAVDARLCVECGVVIPPARVKAVPSVARCVKCQSAFEHTHDTRPHISEGLAGTRDENKKMRGQLWGDMRNRGKGR
jgi:phage/conjugal plasmid C-4 type zinc finger TraR family protein